MAIARRHHPQARAAARRTPLSPEGVGMKRNAPGKPVKPTTVLRVEFVAWVRERAL